VDNVPVLTPAKLLALLRSLPAHMDQIGVMLLAEHTRHQLHPLPEPSILPGHAPWDGRCPWYISAGKPVERSEPPATT
jgi:hypothetical protein